MYKRQGDGHPYTRHEFDRWYSDPKQAQQAWSNATELNHSNFCMLPREAVLCAFERMSLWCDPWLHEAVRIFGTALGIYVNYYSAMESPTLLGRPLYPSSSYEASSTEGAALKCPGCAECIEFAQEAVTRSHNKKWWHKACYEAMQNGQDPLEMRARSLHISTAPWRSQRWASHEYTR